MLWARFAALCGALLFAAGCSFPSNEYERAAAIKVAQAHFGQAVNMQYFDVVSAGVGRDTLFVWGSRVGLVSEPQDRLAKVLRSSGPGTVQIVVAGPVPDKTAVIVKGALERARGYDLNHVHMLVLGAEGDRSDLLRLAQGAGVKLAVVPLTALRRAGREESRPQGERDQAGR
jgi:hypothetical protein